MQPAPSVLEAIAALPFADVATIAGRGPILVIAPHPDDESLGCGGFIAQARMAGAEVHVAILTDGSRSHPNSRSHPAARLKALREEEAAQAAWILGVPRSHVSFLGYPDTAAPLRGGALREAAGRIAGLMRDFAVGTVLSSWQHDPHADHLSAHRITAAAARMAGVRHLSYPVWGWTLTEKTWLPRARLQGYRLDIAAQLPVKRQAIACHVSQTTGLIADDPAGFTIPDRLHELCGRPFEAFILNAA